MKLSIEVFGGPMDGKSYLFDSFPISLGRTSDSDAEFSLDEFISRVHCTIFIENNIFYIADLKSRNGTHLNDNRLEKATPLKDKDIIMIGNTKIKCLSKY